MTKEEHDYELKKTHYDYELRKTHNEILKNEVECTIADGRTEREKYLEQRCEELENRIRKMKIENNLMRELLSKPVSYTYGIR